MKKLFLLVLLAFSTYSHAYVEFNYNRVTSICSGFVTMAVYDGWPTPIPTPYVFAYGSPWQTVNGQAPTVYWNGLAFPVPGAVDVPYQKDCVFHGCYIDGTEAFLKMSCGNAPDIASDTINNDSLLELKTDIIKQSK